MMHEYCNNCSAEQPGRRWEVVCDNCDTLIGEGVTGGGDAERGHIGPHVKLEVDGRLRFHICPRCLLMLGPKFAAMVAAEVSGDLRAELVRLLTERGAIPTLQFEVKS